MLDAAKAIRQFIMGRSYEDYLRDRMLRGAVERHLEIIGEALKRILDKEAGIEISHSKKIISLRNRIIHGYDVISDVLLWGILINDLPKLKSEVSILLK